MATAPGISQGKTEFVQEQFGRDKGATPESVNEAWKSAGKVGTISDSLIKKVRAGLKLGSWGRAEGNTGKKTGAKGRKPAMTAGRAGATPERPRAASGRGDGGRGGNKTTFLRELLGRDNSLDVHAANRAWAEAGNAGSVSVSLFQKVRGDLGLTARRPGRKRQDTSVAATPAPPSHEANGHYTGSVPTPRADRSALGDRARVLDELEAEIDELIFRVREVGDMPEVQEALRAARRLVILGHGA